MRVTASAEEKASGAPLPLLSHIFPIFLTINMKQLNQTHIPPLLAKWQLSHTRGRSLSSTAIFFFFFGVRNSLALPCSPSFDSTGVKQSLTFCPLRTTQNGFKTVPRCHRQARLKGYFWRNGHAHKYPHRVLRNKKKKRKTPDDVIKRSETERKKEGRKERRGNIHQINTSVALIVISPPWRSLRRARQAAKRDLSMQS